jgi:hypothetical protein
MKVLILLLALFSLSQAGMNEYWQRKSKAFMDKVYQEEGV